MTLLERMARAIAQVDHNGRIAGEGYWKDPDTGSGHHIEQARAALTMMLQPSEAMVKAGAGALWESEEGFRLMLIEAVQFELAPSPLTQLEQAA